MKKTSIHDMGLAPLMVALMKSGKTRQQAFAILIQLVGKKFVLGEVIIANGPTS